jgi:hypothetical protein
LSSNPSTTKKKKKQKEKEAAAGDRPGLLEINTLI